MVFVGAPSVECWDGEVADPVPGAVVVRTMIAGVCGTDAHRLDGDLPDPGRPVTFGHEGVGVIEALGAGVTTDRAGVPVRAGDKVYWTPSGDRPGATPPMGWPPPADVPNPASYQDYATLAPSNVFYRIPDDTPPEAVMRRRANADCPRWRRAPWWHRPGPDGGGAGLRTGGSRLDAAPPLRRRAR
jgi:5-exo-hydroxycamphor dehydrogenase